MKNSFQVHPRMRGENAGMSALEPCHGWSIPACAGKTSHVGSLAYRVDRSIPACAGKTAGRGWPGRRVRSIPACAGKTSASAND